MHTFPYRTSKYNVTTPVIDAKASSLSPLWIFFAFLCTRIRILHFLEIPRKIFVGSENPGALLFVASFKTEPFYISCMKMRIEPNGSGGRGKMSNESRKGKRRQKTTPAVQKLYEVCKEVFADCGPGVIPSPENVEKLSAVLDGMSQADVGLRPNMPFFSAPVITYLGLHEGDEFTIGIFCLPPNSVIPLHNHPGMTVFSKLLFGTMHIRSLDWANDSADCTTTNALGLKGHPDGPRMAKVKVNSEFTAPCRTSILYPADGGNMHCFTAKTACAVLDVLGPPYCDSEGRHCQYYLELPLGQISAEKVSTDTSGTVENETAAVEEEKEGYAYTWLKERERPKEHVVVGVTYNGPKIVRK